MHKNLLFKSKQFNCMMKFQTATSITSKDSFTCFKYVKHPSMK